MTTPVDQVLDSSIFALLENTREEAEDVENLLFSGPVAEVVCHAGQELQSCFDQIDSLRRSGYHLCGYIAYEAGRYLVTQPDNAFDQQAHHAVPLLHFYAFKQPRVLSQQETDVWIQAQQIDDVPTAIRHLKLSLSEDTYQQQLTSIRNYIEAGDTYQVNFTQQFDFEYQGCVAGLYQSLRQQQSVAYGSWLNFPEFSVLSFSPELFLKKTGQKIVARPMKGTWPRKPDEQLTFDRRVAMRSDDKNRAENLMIVDLIRNDLGQIAKTGSVEVTNPFDIEAFESLYQMVTTVEAEINTDTSLGEVMKAMFPCGSITGTPKLRTMQIIEELESVPRGVYTGAIGYITPDNDFSFSVPIRTCIADSRGKAVMGVGGGVTHGSNVAEEYRECLLKGKFLKGVNSSFQLIESMRFSAKSGSIPLLEAHLARLNDSASALSFKLDLDHVRKVIMRHTADLRTDHKVRMLLAADGELQINSEQISLSEQRLPSVGISTVGVDSKHWLFQYKTTKRGLYNEAYDRAIEQGDCDVLFFNEQGHLTEASRHNVFIRSGDVWYTPPVASGVLPGIFRQKQINEFDNCRIETINIEQVLACDQMALCNAVRGRIVVQLSAEARVFLREITKKNG